MPNETENRDHSPRLTRREALAALAAGSLTLAAIPARRLAIAATPTFDVKAYGAAGNGSTDDAPAFEKAIAAAAKAGGGIVTVPAGTYIIGSSIRMRSHVTLRGVGDTSILKLRNGASVNVIRSAAQTAANPVTNVGIEKLKIDGNKANQRNDTECYGISLIAANDSWVSGVTVVNTVRSGIYLAGSRNSVTGCRVSGAGLSGGSIIGRSGIVFDTDGTNHPVSSVAKNNSVSDVREHGIKVYYNATGSVIDSNTVKNNGDRGIYSMGARDVTISNNVVSGSGTTGILVGGGGTGSPSNRVRGNKVSGCRSHGILVWDSSGVTVDQSNEVADCGGNGIYFLNSPAGTINGNTVRGSRGDGGVVLYNSSRTAIGTNTVTGNAGSGIQFWDDGSPSTDCKVTGNVCTDGGAGRQQYGVRSLNRTRNLTVTDNDLRGNLTSALSLVGTGNVVSNNLTTGSPSTSTAATKPACTLNRTSAAVGNSLTAKCAGFKPGETVDLFWDKAGTTVRASFKADSAGAGKGTFAIPRAPKGTHAVIAKGRSSGRTAKDSIVVKPSLAMTPSSGRSGTKVTVKLRGFGAGETITLTWAVSSTRTVNLLTGLKASSTGTAGGTFVVPKGATAGQHTIRAAGSAGSAVTATFTVKSSVTAAEVNAADATPTPTSPTKATATERAASSSTPTPESTPSPTPAASPTEPPATTPEPTKTPTATPEPTTAAPEPTPSPTEKAGGWSKAES